MRDSEDQYRDYTLYLQIRDKYVSRQTDSENQETKVLIRVIEDLENLIRALNLKGHKSR